MARIEPSIAKNKSLPKPFANANTGCLHTCVVNEAYRKLEDFLIEECKREIKPLNREEVRTLHTTLLNCRTNFEDEECLTFLKFIKLAF